MKMSFKWDYKERKPTDNPGPYETPVWEHKDILDGIAELRRRTNLRSIKVLSVTLLDESRASQGGRLPPEFIDVVFDGPPGPQGPRLVEVENPQGASIWVGEWIKRADGYWVLRIKPEVFK